MTKRELNELNVILIKKKFDVSSSSIRSCRQGRIKLIEKQEKRIILRE